MKVVSGHQHPQMEDTSNAYTIMILNYCSRNKFKSILQIGMTVTIRLCSILGFHRTLVSVGHNTVQTGVSEGHIDAFFTVDIDSTLCNKSSIHLLVHTV